MCVKCYEREGHNHPMAKINEGDSSAPVSNSNPNNKRDSVQKCIRSLVHACQCRDANCKLPNCQKMKKVVAHTSQCQKKNDGCALCKQLLALCCFHARHCTETNCKVPICANIKMKLKQQQAQARMNHVRKLYTVSHLLGNKSLCWNFP